LALEDVHAGVGVVVLDPHGDLMDRIASEIPAHRRSDLVVLDLSDARSSVAINPLEGTAQDKRLRALVAGQIVDLIELLFESNDSSGPMLRNHVRHALLLAMCHPQGGTLADASRIFMDSDFRDWLLGKADERLASYFSTFLKTNGEHGYSNWLPYLLARFEPFIGSRSLLTTLSRPSTVDLSALLKSKAIILCRLPRTELSETECRVLGTLLLQSLFSAAMHGRRNRDASVPCCRVICDEFHLFSSPAIVSCFREARKFGLHLTVATQSFASLTHAKAPHLANEVLTNTAAKIFFRVSPREGHQIDEYTAPRFRAQDLATLRSHHAVLALPSEGLEAFSFRPMLPRTLSEPFDLESVKALAAQRHGTPMGEACEYVAKRHGIEVSQLI
jgi:hypothetical protein